MQAVIMAAGKSTRTRPLTDDIPKPLLKILDKAIIEYTLEAIQGIVSEAIIIVGFKKEKIINFLGDNYKGIKIRYIEQREQKGTGHALMLVKNVIKGKFIIIAGDDLFSPEDIKRCCSHDYCILGQEVKDPENYGILFTEKGFLKKIVEKPKTYIGNFANTGLYVADKEIFNTELKETERGELEATDMVTSLAERRNVVVETVKGYWKPVSYPSHYLETNLFMLKLRKLGYFIGKNSDIDGDVKLVNSVIMDNVKFKASVAIKDSVVLDNAEVTEDITKKIVGEKFVIDLDR